MPMCCVLVQGGCFLCTCRPNGCPFKVLSSTTAAVVCCLALDTELACAK